MQTANSNVQMPVRSEGFQPLSSNLADRQDAHAHPRLTRPPNKGWKPSPHSSGFVMLEAVLALGLFATVATAMAIALNQLSSANTDMRREALLLRTLESAMTEAAHRTPLEPRFETTPTNAFGVGVETQIAPLNLKNQRGQQLRGLYQITVTATFDDGSDAPNPMQRSLEQTVFAENAGGNTTQRAATSTRPNAKDAEGITAISQGLRARSKRHPWTPITRADDPEGVVAAIFAPTRLAPLRGAFNNRPVFPGYRSCLAQPRANGWEAFCFQLPDRDDLHSHSVAAR